MYLVDDIRCGELSSEVVSRSDFESDVPIETGAEVFDSPGRDELFTIACNGVCEVFGGCVYACEGVKSEPRKVVLYTIGEGGPVGSMVVGEGAFGGRCVGAVECMFNEQGEMVGWELKECFPRASEGEVRGGEGDVWGGGLRVYVIGSAGGCVGVVKDCEVWQLLGEGLASCVCCLCK